MDTDEEAIRNLVETWHRATAAGDIDTVLSLMAEDAVFLVPGRPPMRGSSMFEKGLRELLGSHRVEPESEIEEIEISGNLAYCWTRLTVRIVPRAGGDPVLRCGSALSILRRQADGVWQLVRDANLLASAA